MHSFKSYTVYQNKLLEKISDVSYLYEALSPASKQEILTMLDGINDDQVMDIKNAILKKAISYKMNVFVEKIGPRFKSNYINYLENIIHVSKTDPIEKILFIDLIMDDTNKIGKEIFTKPSHGHLEDLISKKILKNKCYQDLKKKIFDYKTQGIGKGEFFLALFCKNGQLKNGRVGGDIIVDNWKVEVKASNNPKLVQGGSPGSAMVPGSTTTVVSGSEVYKVNKELISKVEEKYGKEKYNTEIANANIFRLYPKKSKNEGGDWFWMFFQKLKKDNSKEALELMTWYLSKMFKDNNINNLPKNVLNALGSRTNIPKAFSGYVFDRYKQYTDFDSLICVNEHTWNFANSVSGGSGYSKKILNDGPDISFGNGRTSIFASMGIGVA